MYYIGVDLGTSAVKLLLMEGSGKICNIVSKEYPLVGGCHRRRSFETGRG